MEEKLKKLKSKIRKLKKQCETWIKYTGDDKVREAYMKMNSALEEILEEE